MLYASSYGQLIAAKEFWSQCHILRIIYVLYMYYICIIYVSYMYYIICIRSAFAGFCLLFLGFLVFFASAAIFVCAFAGFCWLFLGFWRPRRFLYVLFLAFVGFFGVRGDFCMPDAGRCENTVQKEGQIILQGGGTPGGIPGPPESQDGGTEGGTR